MTKAADLKKQYMKERRRAQKAIARAKKEGYTVDIILPDIPKKITVGSINRLKTKYSTKVINQKSTKIDNKGNISNKLQDINRKRWKKKAAEAKPKQPEPTEPAETAPDEYQFLVDKIWELIDSIPACDLKKYSKNVSQILRGGFSQYVRDTENLPPEQKKEACKQLRYILAQGILHYEYFDSEQVGEASALASDIGQLGNELGSETISDLAATIADEDEYIDDDMAAMIEWMAEF